MNRSDTSANRVRKRTTNACRRCKKRKVKCSGQWPCRNCDVGKQECIFDESDRRMVVSQRHFRDLQRKAGEMLPEDSASGSTQDTQNDQTQSTHDGPIRYHFSTAYPSYRQTDDGVATPNDVVSAATSISRPSFGNNVSSGQNMRASPDDITNPLTATPSRYATDQQGSKRYLGHSSTWSFSRQVRLLVRDYVEEFNLYDETTEIEGTSYKLSFLMEGRPPKEPMTDTPSRDFVEYMLHTVEFGLGPTFRFFDKALFREFLDMHHASCICNSDAEASEFNQRPPDLWYVQLYMVTALGKLFLGRKATDFGPPGADYFLRAMYALPSIAALFVKPILAIEILCLLALYLQSANMRNAAYIYIGQAIRIALSKGLNRQTDPEYFTPQQYSHNIKVWWSLYCLDRKLSILMGAPFALNDEDISTPLPEGQDVASQSLQMNIALCRLSGKVVATVYRLNGFVDKPFLEGVQDVLKTMTELNPQLSIKVPLFTFQTISRSAATLHLAYHQCAILAIRPLLFHLAQKTLEMTKVRQTPKSPSEPVKALLNTCIEAATNSLEILKTLHDQDLIELFLPFDSEATFSSAFVMTLARILTPEAAPTPRYFDIAKAILHDMAFRGNKQAASYETELRELHDMIVSLETRTIQREESNSHAALSPGTVLYTVSSFPTNTLPGTSEINTMPGFENGAMQEALDILGDDFYTGLSFDIVDDQWFWATNV